MIGSWVGDGDVLVFEAEGEPEDEVEDDVASGAVEIGAFALVVSEHEVERAVGVVLQDMTEAVDSLGMVVELVASFVQGVVLHLEFDTVG